MRRNTLKTVLFLGTIFVLILSACGGKPQAPTPTQAPPTAIPTNTPIPEPTDTPIPPLLVTSTTDLKKATIQIQAEGTFIDPEWGYIPNAAGRGSGFIIDPSGIAVTNNHVVTGAALLKVWVGGDTSKTYNAKVLGVSECSDLAVIDIEGDGFPYLEWYDQPTQVSLDVFLGGFPLGDPEFTLTKGIIAKENANGDTQWASVDKVIQHTADSNPGNSGGPLVDANAKVVGIHYAGAEAVDQHFAIDHSIALPVVEQLKAGTNVDTIGINGQAVMSEDGSFSGIWVSSVKSGSEADNAGLQAGDVITTIEDFYLATDGTMKDYCDILRTHTAGDTLGIEFIRFSTGDIYKSQLNGRAPEIIGNIYEAVATDEPPAGETPVAGNLPTNCVASDTPGFIGCIDDTGSIYIEVPDYWTDINGSPWVYDNQTIGVALNLAPSVSDFYDYYNAEGVFIGASDTFAQLGGYVEFLDYYTTDYSGGCTLVGRYDYNDGYYRGKYDVYSDCGGAGGYVAAVLCAVDIADPTSKIIVLEVQLDPNDGTTWPQITATFYVDF